MALNNAHMEWAKIFYSVTDSTYMDLYIYTYIDMYARIESCE